MTCPTPRTLPTGEQECPRCGMTWDPEDGPPVCGPVFRAIRDSATPRPTNDPREE